MAVHSENIIEVRDLDLSFQTDEQTAQVLHRVNFTIPRGKTIALAGESGSGKSVTALSILRLLDPEVSKVSGKILFEGQDLNTLDEEAMRRIRGNRIAMIFQEPMTSLNPVYSVGAQVMESLAIHQGLDSKTARTKAIELLERTGIGNAGQRIDSYPHQLSGGQRQRVMIAMALACRPVLLIADEPTTALDVTIQAQILQLIKDLQAEMEMAVLLITHDLAMVRKTALTVHIMHQGKIVESGATTQIFSSPQDPYTKHLLECFPKGGPAPKEEGQPLLEIRKLVCDFPVRRGFLRRIVSVHRAVDGVNLTIRQGTTLGLVGESGSGKSTLGLCLLRLTGCRGEIFYRGEDLLGYDQRRMRPLRKELQVVFQDPFSSLSPRMTIEQIIAEGMIVHGIGGNRTARRKLIEAVLETVGLDQGMAERYPHEFSGGQRQRIAIARAVVLQPRFLVLDEPTSALDMTVQSQIIDLLRDLQARFNMTYLFISHDLRVVRAMADEVAVMLDGRVVEYGPASIFDQPTHPYSRKLFAAAFDLNP
ncbi:MAG: ABC transporter ATP-binding protein [Proteobacteria bacterium]|nr:ABC transporter ATP-binding protein [Pseudomonadota bacterium]MBU1686464.1 ABC transporter ATP-binding protein [Pseudomonadota bacterium]